MPRTTTSFYSVRGLHRWSSRQGSENLAEEATALLAAKWEKPYSQVCGYVNARMSIAIVRVTHLYLRGSRIPTGRMSRHPQWEDSAGLSIFHR
jgi:hypothetical protein